MASKMTEVAIIMTKTTQRNCRSPEQWKAILGGWLAGRMFGIAKRPTFRKMAKSGSLAISSKKGGNPWHRTASSW
jgi:hypothetical protein